MFGIVIYLLKNMFKGCVRYCQKRKQQLIPITDKTINGYYRKNIEKGVQYGVPNSNAS